MQCRYVLWIEARVDPLLTNLILALLGNHAQGVALAGYKLGIPCTIVMPVATPTIKWRNVERLGAKIVLHGEDFDQAKAECARLTKQHSLIYVPPYDDPLVLAGQGTIAMEILRQVPEPDKLDGIFGAVGGGGLTGGMSAYVKNVAPPSVKVYGVETVDGDALKRSLEKGERVLLDEVGAFSDGTAVKIVGEECFRVCQKYLDGVEICTNDEICAAMRDIFEGASTQRSMIQQRADSCALFHRDPNRPRALRCPCPCRTQVAHHQKQLAGCRQAVRCHRLGCQRQLQPAQMGCRPCGAGRTTRGPDERHHTRVPRKVRLARAWATWFDL